MTTSNHFPRNCAREARSLLAKFRVVAFITPLFFPLPVSAVVKDKLPASGPVTFSDGAIATAFDHCGDADLCATIAYTNGDLLSIYSMGAAFCQPYQLHFVRAHGGATEYEFSRTLNHDAVTTSAFGTHCGNNQATQMTLDRGLAHLTVDEYSDGSLRFIFSSKETTRQQEAQ